MRINIFGASYAYPRQLYISDDHPILNDRRNKIGKPWSVLLSEKYIVNNYSVPGASTLYSYNKFLYNRRDADLNIFLTVPSNRLSVCHSKKYFHFYGVDQAQDIYNKATSAEEKAISNAAVEYYLNLFDPVQADQIDALIHQHIISLDPDCLFLDTTQSKNSLRVIDNIESRSLNFKTREAIKSLTLDLRYCHMTKENNQLVYDKVVNYIEHGVRFALDPTEVVRPTREDKDLYIIHNFFKK